MEATEHLGSEDKSLRRGAEPVPETRAGGRGSQSRRSACGLIRQGAALNDNRRALLGHVCTKLSGSGHCFRESVYSCGTAVHPAGRFGATPKCSKTSEGTSGKQREVGIVCSQFLTPTWPVQGRALHVPSSETGPGGGGSGGSQLCSPVPSHPQASPAHLRPGQSAGSLSALTARHKPRWGRLGSRRCLLLHSMDVASRARLRRPPGLARAAQSQRFREAGAARMNSFFPPLGSDRKTGTLSQWPQVRPLPVSPG